MLTKPYSLVDILWVMYAFIAGAGYIHFYFDHKKIIINLWFLGDFYALLGLIITLLGYGLLNHHKSFSSHSWFRETNSIISRLVTLIFSISMITFIIFFYFFYFFSIIDNYFLHASPFFLIIYSIIVIVPSIYIGQYFERPFKKIQTNIHLLLNEQNMEKMDNVFLITEFVFLQQFIMSSFNTLKEKIQVEKKLVDLASQVAHDIRSPLTALDMLLLDMPEIEEEKRIIIRNANARIRDIANNLLSNNNPIKKIKQITTTCLLVDIIESSISEKRIQVNTLGISINFQATQECYDIFSNIQTTEFSSVISNLLNNAIEALKEHGTINMTLLKKEGYAIIIIHDNGVGIPDHIIKQLGTTGLTYGKKNGHGLGIVHAMSTIASWNGQINFDSLVGQGTSVTIHLPLCPPPSWFPKEIRIHDNTDILILDDDSSIHDVWDRRFKPLKLTNKNIACHHFYDELELQSWLKKDVNHKRKLTLCDYEIIGSNQNGLDILENTGLIKNSVLVTSRYQNQSIMTRCKILDIKVLPKSLAIFVPILI